MHESALKPHNISPLKNENWGKGGGSPGVSFYVNTIIFPMLYFFSLNKE